jgi:hypothetical protein
MGICMGSEQREAAARSADIDKKLAQDQQKYERTVKLLLLGEWLGGFCFFRKAKKRRKTWSNCVFFFFSFSSILLRLLRRGVSTEGTGGALVVVFFLGGDGLIQAQVPVRVGRVRW